MTTVAIALGGVIVAALVATGAVRLVEQVDSAHDINFDDEEQQA